MHINNNTCPNSTTVQSKKVQTEHSERKVALQRIDQVYILRYHPYIQKESKNERQDCCFSFKNAFP